MPKILVQKDAGIPATETRMSEALGSKRHGCSVWQLRPGPPVPELCLVVRAHGETDGSLRFWGVMLCDRRIMLLGQLAVRPCERERGFGRDLIKATLKRAKLGPWELGLVSGEVDYYPRFRFAPAAS